MTMWIFVGLFGMAGFMAGLSFLMLKILRSEVKYNQEQFLRIAKEQYEAAQNKATTELETRRQAIDGTVKGLKDQLEQYQKLIHEMEQDRAQKYGNIEAELKNTSLATCKLQETTAYLNNILGNVKLRGQWGERMAEDIIQYAGLIEGINYQKQKQLQTASTKPDFTFFLPNDFKVNMDVKFPLDNYICMINAVTEAERISFEKEFVKNVKERIKEIQNRDYINPAENTLDFVLLFIPNEQVFGMIQEKMPGLLDTALQQKVVLCSPFTLYAMLSVIRQAHENFRYEKDIKKIILLIDQFVKVYEKFKTRFEDIGESLSRLEQQYSDVREKSFKNLDTKMRHIDAYKKGRNISLEPGEDVIDLIDGPSSDPSS